MLGVGNPLGVKLLQDNGLGTPSMWPGHHPAATGRHAPGALHSARSLYIEGPDGLGGFTRYYEMPEIVRTGAPVYLKFGLRNALPTSTPAACTWARGHRHRPRARDAAPPSAWNCWRGRDRLRRVARRRRGVGYPAG